MLAYSLVRTIRARRRYAESPCGGQYRNPATLRELLALAPRVDTIVVATCDETLIPLFESLKAHGCRIELASLERGTPIDLIRAASCFVPITISCLFSEPKFSASAAPSTFSPPTVKRNPRYKGLPDDEELERESAALTGATPSNAVGCWNFLVSPTVSVART